MKQKAYDDCCRRSASDPGIEFCPVCGQQLLRCLAYADCAGLVNQSGACDECVKPILLMASGAGVQTKKGERVSISLVLRNGSNVRPILVKRIARLDDTSEVPLRLTWQQIEPGGDRHFNLDTPPLEVGGSYTFTAMVVVSIVYDGIEESYAYQGSVLLRTVSEDAQNVSTTITVLGNIEGTGHLLNANAKGNMQTGAAGAEQLTQVPLQRGDSYELDNGFRGYTQEKFRVPRNVNLAFAGFSTDDAPQSARILASRGRFKVGRNSRTFSDPNDLCLRAYKSSGEYDEPATNAISRHHFDLIVANDRMYAQALAGSGIRVNNDVIPTGELVLLRPGDKLVPIPDHPEKVALQFTFSRKLNAVDRVTVLRTPTIK